MAEPTPAAEPVRRPLLDVLVEHVGAPLPDGSDTWGMRSVHHDFRSSHGYRWPWPGGVALAPGPLTEHDGPCPRAPGDGICVALTPEGMASGGIPALTVLLVAYREADVLGRDRDKVRLRSATVVEVVDLPRLARERRADLRGADLRGAYLGGADLRGADLGGAYLGRADLRGAYLGGAYLGGADLGGADLGGWERGPDGYARQVTS